MESAEEKTDYSQELDNPYRYAGYEYLDSVDRYDLNARYYNPKTARFLSEDPYYNLGNRVIGLYEINVPSVLSIMQANALYAYCGENPVKFTDPYGKGFGMIVLLSMILLPIGYGLLAHDAAMPSHNYDQNAQMDEAVNRYHLSKEGRRLLHDEISGQNYSYQEVMEEAAEIARRGGKYVK